MAIHHDITPYNGYNNRTRLLRNTADSS